MRIWVYFIVVSAALPALHVALISSPLGGPSDAYHRSLFLFFEASIWVSSIAILLMDGYRTRVVEGALPLREAIIKTLLAGLLTPLVTLLISPLGMGDVGASATIVLALTGALIGTGAGWWYWSLGRTG